MTAEANAAVTGYFGAPVMQFGGDQNVVREAIENFGDIETIMTKVNH